MTDNKTVSFDIRQRRKIVSLIRRECCNYENSRCILLDSVCPQIISLSLICSWFALAVLPLDNELNIQILKKKNMGKCAYCGKLFVKTGNRSKYCNVCRIIVRRQKKAEYERKRRRESGQIRLLKPHKIKLSLA